MERAFGVLRSKFRIIYNPARLWSQSDLNDIMRACVILHNMVIEDERNLYSDHQEFERSSDPPISQNRDVPELRLVCLGFTSWRGADASSLHDLHLFLLVHRTQWWSQLVQVLRHDYKICVPLV